MNLQIGKTVLVIKPDNVEIKDNYSQVLDTTVGENDRGVIVLEYKTKTYVQPF